MSMRLADLLIPDTTGLRDTLRALQRNASGAAFVVDAAGVLTGIVTDGDVRRAILGGATLETSVSDFMTKQPVTARVGDSAATMLGLLSGRVRHLPIVDETGRVVDHASFGHGVRLPVAAPAFHGNELRYVTECVATNWISSQGRFVGEFEQKFAEFVGARFGIAVSNGTVALHLALVLGGIGPGDEVIVPTLTFAATANAVRHAGADPVFVDSDPLTWNMDPAAVERQIGARTKAIIPVHLYGHPADMDALTAIAHRHGLFVVEDAAEAHGARIGDTPVGAIGHIGCFSFFGNKIITTGEGGMLTTNDPALAERARVLRDHGMSRQRKYWHETVGYNYRLTNLQAAVGVAQLEQIDGFLEKRRAIAEWYSTHLASDSRVELPGQAPWARRVNWLFTVMLRDGIDRDHIVARLNDRGIDSRPVFAPVHTMPPYATGQQLPVAEDIARRGLSLPSSIGLAPQDIARVCEALSACLTEESTATAPLSGVVLTGSQGQGHG
jgi:perosamine synthetase